MNKWVDGCKRVLPTDVTVTLTADVTRRVRLLSACYLLCVHYNQAVLKLLVMKRNGAFRVLKVILQSARQYCGLIELEDELLLYQYIFECVEVTLTQIIIIIMAELPTSAILVNCSGFL